VSTPGVEEFEGKGRGGKESGFKLPGSEVMMVEVENFNNGKFMKFKKSLGMMLGVIGVIGSMGGIGWVGQVKSAGNTVYVATTGSDNNNGSISSPFKTFAKAINVVGAGDTIVVRGGTYKERLNFNKSGSSGAPITATVQSGEKVIVDMQNSAGDVINIPAGIGYINVNGFEIANSSGYGIRLSGHDIKAENLYIHHAQLMGLYMDGQNLTVRGNRVTQNSLVDKGTTASSGWGSGIKCRVGGNNILLENNTTFNNWGEGMAITRCSNVTARNNVAYDNFSVNFYIDNSYDVTFEKNFSYCTINSGFEKNGNPASGFAIGEEFYDGWGAKLARVKILNNISTNCSRGVIAFAADVPGGGLDNVVIANNTFWNSINNTVSLQPSLDKTRNVRVFNNIIYQFSGKEVWVEDRTGITMNNNFWVGVSSVSAGNGSGPGDVFGDVKMATSPNNNPTSFGLASNSPAINGGVADALIKDDFESKLRSGLPDMGAIEYGGNLPTATPTPVPNVKPGDTNGDGRVDGLDYVVWLTHYGITTANGYRDGDFNNDGRVDGVDYVAWIMGYGK
jgi:hypothetical protein